MTVNALPTATIAASGPTSFCTGGSVTLSAPAGLSYLWSTGATSQSITASTSGSYSVTVTNGSNCSATSAATVVTVTPTPSLSITAPETVCAPATVNLTAAAVTTGSTLPNGTVLSYWTDAAATTPLNNPAAVAASGTYYIKATNGSCTDVKPVSVTINPAPTTAHAGPDQSVDGETATLAANEPQVGTGTWSIVSGTGGSFTDATKPTTTFKGVAGTTYKLLWSIGTGLCPASTDEVSVELKKVSTTTTVADASGVYGSNAVTLSATVQPNPGGGSVDFYLGGSKVGTGTVGNSGVATYTYDASQLNASGTTPYSISAHFLGADFYTASNSAPGQLTINPAPALISLSGLSTTYDGSAKAATAETKPAGLAVSITYDSNAAAPTNAGTYAVVATLNNANYTAPEAKGSLVIAKASNSISFDAPADRTYEPDAKLTLAATATSGQQVSFAVTDGPASISGNTLAITGAGDITVEATQAGNSNYAAAAPVSRTFRVAKADQTIGFAGLADKTFGAADFELSASSTAKLPVSFAVTGNATLLDDGKTIRLTGAGSVTVTATQPGDANYNAATAVSRTFAVGKAAATLQLGQLAFDYDGNPKPVAVTTDPTALTGVSITYDGSATAPTAAGSYAVVASLANANYQATNATGTLVISKAAATVELAGLSQTYSATAKTVTASTPATGSSSFSYSFKQGNTSVTEPTAAGSYEVTATLSNANYTGSAKGTLIIAPAALAITVTNESRAYNTANPSLTGTLTGVQGTDAITASYSTTADAASNVGKYPITATLLDPDGKLSNYTVTNTPGELSITPAAATLSLANLGGHTYDGTTKGAEVSTSPTNLAYTITYNGAPAQPSAAGSYNVVATLTNGNYSAADATGTLTIAQRALTAKANDKTRTYGGANPTLDGEVEGAVSGDGITATYSTAADATSSVGSYDIKIQLNDPNNKLGNYSVSKQDGKLTVGKAQLTVTANDDSRAYGQANPSFTSIMTGYVNGDGAAAHSGAPALSTTANADSPVGTYSITAALGSLQAANYTFAFVPGTLTIGKAALSAKADDKSRTYGDANPAFTGTLTGVRNADAITASYSTTATTATGVGTYDIVSTLTDPNSKLGNYEVSLTSATLTIGTRPVTVTADNKTKEYGDADPNLTYQITAGSLVNGNSFSGSIARASGEDVGSYTIGRNTLTLGANYQLTFGEAQLTIGKAPLTVAANNANRAYGDDNPAFGVSYSGFKKSETETVLSGSLSLQTSATKASPVGSYDITASGLTSGNYHISFKAGELTIGTRAIAIKANAQSKVYGTTDPALTYTITAGSLANNDKFSGALGRVSGEGVGSYAIEQRTLALSNNYALNYTGANLQITQAALVVVSNPKTKTYGDALQPTDFTGSLDGVVSGDNITVSRSSTGAAATANTGSYDIVATLDDPGNKLGNYTVSNPAGTLTVNKAPLAVQAHDKSKTYGAPLPTLTGTLTGVRNADAITEAYSTTATPGSNVGTYTIVADVAATPAVLANYSLSKTNATLTIGKAALVVTANNATKAYGAALPAFSVSYSGLVNGDTAPKTPPTIGTTATAGSPVKAGGYPLTAQGAVDGNYDISYQAGTLTVTPVDLIVTADNKSKVYGQVNPAFTASYSGLVNSDTPASLGGSLSFATQATASSPVGAYDVTPSGLTSGNYTLAFKAGTLTIGKAQLSATANNKSRLYGGANPAFDGTLSGVQNTDAITASYTSMAKQTTGTGTYSIVTSLNDPDQKLGNYEVKLTNGILTIDKATLTVTADNKSKTYGDLNPALTVSYSGFVLNQTASVLTTAPTASTTSTQGSGAGIYPITAAGGASNNYAFTYVAGTLTVGKAELTVKANDASRTYGQANPLFAATITGYVNGDGASAHSGVPSLTTTATSSSPVNTYSITAALGSLQAANYSFAFAPGTLTIGKATITVGNTNRSKTYGAGLAATDFAGTLEGVVSGDGITATRSSVGAAAAAIVGQYPIKAALLDPNSKLSNYTVTNTDGTLTVDKAQLTVTAANQQRTYGDANPTLTGQLTGVQNADAITASYSTTATAATGVGSYAIEPALNDPAGKLSNYTLTKINGTLTINPRAVTVTADSKTMVYGETEPALTYKVSAGTLVNNDAFTGALSRQPGTDVGTYAILRNNLALGGNYTLTYVGANLTITPQFANPVADTYYTGSKFYWSTGPTSNTVTLNLVTTLKNNPNYGGDIRTAKASFFVRKADGSLTAINGAQNLPVGLVNPGDMSTGTASANVQYTFSGSAAVIDIAVKVSGNYRSFDDGSKDAPVTLAVPTPGGLIAGGGSFTEAGSAGYIKGSAGYAFYVQYNKSLKNPQGSVSVTVRSKFDRTGKEDGKLHTYLLKSNAISVLAVNNPKAQFSGKANIKEIVDGVEQSIEGNCNMQLELMDGVGNPVVTPATQDLLAVTIYRANGGVWYSSQWGGTEPVMRVVEGKDVVTVNGAPNATAAVTATTPSSTASLAIAAPAAPAPKQAEVTLLEVYPNPIADKATVRFRAAKGGKAQVYLYNQLGALVTTLYNAEVQGGQEYLVPLQAISLPTGTYFCRLIINGQVENRRITVAK
ncbi:MBG domain-containing protein [Solirubrum puertoriconensis]|uniref:Ig-like domain-containing protein n=1 Tax=Solirubrum puertoriconensis TaxID=1751427 RepID=A0A9X0HLF7_SOLP1|nr:MBG domain-containing protein [Solirubrum puertoriconensis]KUG08110.1 hypothetical protein ASU33_07895 [Solirubrum puertoriconensis]